MQEPEEPLGSNQPTVAEPTVYVVDDDPAMRSSLRWLIESVGLIVRTCASVSGDAVPTDQNSLFTVPSAN